MHEEIQKRAYALWEADGRPEGQDLRRRPSPEHDRNDFHCSTTTLHVIA